MCFEKEDNEGKILFTCFSHFILSGLIPSDVHNDVIQRLAFQIGHSGV